MKERIIAIIACSIIFVTVLTIAVTTAARSSTRPPQLPSAEGVVTAPPRAVATAENNDLPDEPPPVHYRYKRSGSSASPFRHYDLTQAKNLNQNLRQYQFKAGILIDMTNGKVLWEKDSSTPVPIASLTKLLTIYTAFEELERRSELALHSSVTASPVLFLP